MNRHINNQQVFPKKGEQNKFIKKKEQKIFVFGLSDGND
jgi:hypothetical protein